VALENLKRNYVTAKERQVFIDVLNKLRGMSVKARRKNKCWKEIRNLLIETGNWKNAKRGKPSSKNFLPFEL